MNARLSDGASSFQQLRDQLRALSAAPLAPIPGSDSPLELAALLRDPPLFFLERFARYGHVFKSRLVFPVVFLVGAEANRTMLVTRRAEFAMGRGYQKTAVDRIFSGSIMLQDGEDHRRTRGILSPAVGRLAVRESAESVSAIWRAVVARLAAGDDAHDVYTIAQRTTFDVAANVLTGLQLGDETERLRPDFEALIDGIMAPTKHRIPGGVLDRALRARERLERALVPRVEAARAEAPRGLVGALAHHRDEDGTQLTPDEVASHLLLLFWAAYDTTASATSWVLKTLAERPDWQDRIRAEIAASVRDDVGAVEGTSELPALDWFLWEIERMYPSPLFFPRVLTEEVTYAGYRLPAETAVMYTPYLSHRDPATWTDPHAFVPERWGPGAR
jgi:cytochrome P450